MVGAAQWATVALESLSLLDSGLPLPLHHPPTGRYKCQDIWKMNSESSAFGPLCSHLDRSGPR